MRSCKIAQKTIFEKFPKCTYTREVGEGVDLKFRWIKSETLAGGFGIPFILEDRRGRTPLK